MRFDRSKNSDESEGLLKTPTRRIGEVSGKPLRREVRQIAKLRREAEPTIELMTLRQVEVLMDFSCFGSDDPQHSEQPTSPDTHVVDTQ
jgi:hypothetical protein